MTRRRGDEGQATVELALVLPVFVLLLLLLIQVGVLVRDQVMVIHAAREGARTAAVTGANADAAEKAALAAAGLPLRSTDVVTTPPGTKHDLVRVEVRYTDSTNVPLVGRLLGDVHITGAVSMRVEPG
ncbi:MAG TPA: TadE/TadG family type IV pilus assembly protein [Acidimicrobiales bacterium]|nr:TadE/TadG family type IV pilus assembly protein [Acidimicrobiales bacterium]